jgi:hypothetical protein
MDLIVDLAILISAGDAAENTLNALTWMELEAMLGQHRLYLSFAPPGGTRNYLQVRFEEPSRKLVRQWKWNQQTDIAGFFAEGLRYLEQAHGGSFPREEFDPAALLTSLVRTMEVGFLSTTRQPGITPGITGIIEMPNEDFVVTGRELRCLYNDFQANSRDLHDLGKAEAEAGFAWRSERNLTEAWRAATELLSPG